MSYRFATYEKRGRVAYVALNRPEVMNSLHLEAHLELAEIWDDFRDDPDVWVAILTGTGERAFSAGNDLKATARRTTDGSDVQGDARPPFGRITREFTCSKPMIAAVNGVALGGGLELALACDIIVAADHARFGLPEPRVGLFAGAGGIHRLARQVPFKVAMGLLLTGRMFGAEEAHLELAEIWEDFRDDPGVWVAILTGAGERAFSAGNDLKATAERTADGSDVQGDSRPPFGRITRDFHCPKPMIAAVNGVAVGGGLELALACDIIVAADHARFGLPEPRVGLFAGAGGIHRLARQLPFKIAMGLLLTGRLFGAEEAHRIGLVNEVVPLADLIPAAERWAGEILECSPLSVQLTKESALDGLQHSVDEALARDDDRVRRLLASADFVEGPKAFSERRTPKWTGR